MRLMKVIYRKRNKTVANFIFIISCVMFRFISHVSNLHDGYGARDVCTKIKTFTPPSTCQEEEEKRQGIRYSLLYIDIHRTQWLSITTTGWVVQPNLRDLACYDRGTSSRAWSAVSTNENTNVEKRQTGEKREKREKRVKRSGDRSKVPCRFLL